MKTRVGGLFSSVMIFLSLSFTQAYSQSPQVEWQETFGEHRLQEGRDIVQTEDGGYVVCGQTPFGENLHDVYLMKTDALGIFQWSKTFGGRYNDFGFSLERTDDLGYIIAGSTESSGFGMADAYLIKTDANGNYEWSRTYGGARNDLAFSVRKLGDSGYIVGGWTASFSESYDFYFLRIDVLGNVLSEDTFDTKRNDGAFSVEPTDDGGCIAVGWTESLDEHIYDALIVKMSDHGSLQWSRVYSQGISALGAKVVQTSDRGFAVAGTAAFRGLGSRVFMLKLDLLGFFQWQRMYGDENSINGTDLIQTADLGFALTGWTALTKTGPIAVYLLKTDALGVAEREEQYLSADDSGGYGLVQTKDGGFAISGWAGNSYDLYIVKLRGEDASQPRFIRGDCNGDTGVNVTDIVILLKWLFSNTDHLELCLDACDTNDDSAINITDAVHLISYLFLGGPLPLEPFPDPGADPTPDTLICKAEHIAQP